MSVVVETIERASPLQLLAGTALSVAVPLGGMLVFAPMGDALMGLLASGALIAGAAAGLHRRRVAELPLQLAERAATSVHRGERLVRFRCWLGRGRQMQVERVSVRLVHDGHTQDLMPVVGAGAVVFGPLTLLVPGLPEQLPAGARFEVDVQVVEGERRWAASSTYAASDLQEGRFQQGVGTKAGICFEPANFGTVSG